MKRVIPDMFPVHLYVTAVPKLLPPSTYMFLENSVSKVILLSRWNTLPPSLVLDSRYLKCKFILASQILESVASANLCS